MGRCEGRIAGSAWPARFADRWQHRPMVKWLAWEDRTIVLDCVYVIVTVEPAAPPAKGAPGAGH
jgi:hypothetical protein